MIRKFDLRDPEWKDKYVYDARWGHPVLLTNGKHIKVGDIIILGTMEPNLKSEYEITNIRKSSPGYTYRKHCDLKFVGSNIEELKS